MKPEDKTDEIRVMEKLEIERVWWELLGVNFSYFVGNELTNIQSSNINWATHPMRTDDTIFTTNDLDLAASLLKVGAQFIRDICNLFVSIMGLPSENALNMLRYLIGTSRSYQSTSNHEQLM